MNARQMILDILYRVFSENGYASLMMRRMKADEKDTAFIAETVYGTLRNYSLLEYQWRDKASRTKLKTALLLDMSVYQLLFMDVPAYAAVNEAVSLASKHEKKFVNAILRSVMKEGLRKPQEAQILYSHPAWIASLFKAHYGVDNALKIMAYNQQKPLSWGRINTLKTTLEEVKKEEGLSFVDEIAFTYEGALQKSSLFQQGKVLIQNYSSQQIVKFLDVRENMRVLDACAAPGTKTQQIAMFMNNKGEIIANELHEHRLKLIGQLMERTGTTIVKTVQGDASEENRFEKESFDRILLDVPCSGLGDLSHKPEIRWHLKPEDIDEITKIQLAILHANAPYLRKSGVMVYSTCTLNRKENENQIRVFLKTHEDFELQEEHTFFPFAFKSDGFYCAALRKRKS
ncbi:MAG: 16S rRNA (cytosine(967)-C(5))-methyltransferase RsmB [Solobacterium sp.]|nr:16S rRNA (cytosine(967)-C(5))-methyltransferase RsmB [Solobacterium sp.]